MHDSSDGSRGREPSETAGQLIEAFRWEPGLDGLRALAVLHVMVHHMNAGLWIGFWGVDLFFVLSGFLITTVLYKEIQRHGDLNLKRFYIRRVLRLYPALAGLLLIWGGFWYTQIRDPDHLHVFEYSTLAALLYSFNLLVANGKPTFIDWNHLWSLCIEEHYYFLWPGLLAWMARRGRVLASAGILLAASLAWLLFIVSLHFVSPLRVYYATDTRAFELMAGGAFALLPAGLSMVRMQRVLKAADRLAVGLMVGLVLYSFVPTLPWRSILCAHMVLMSLATGIILLNLAYGDNRLLSKVLGCAPLVYVGRISYSLYLWNWPLSRAFELHMTLPHGIAEAATMVATVVVAMLSYHCIEQPIANRFLSTARADRVGHY